MKLTSIVGLLTINTLVFTSPAQSQSFYNPSDFVSPSGLTTVYNGTTLLRHGTAGYITNGFKGYITPVSTYAYEDTRVVNGRFGDSKGREGCRGSIVVKFSYDGAPRMDATWKVQGHYPGKRCNSIGKVFTVNDLR